MSWLAGWMHIYIHTHAGGVVVSGDSLLSLCSTGRGVPWTRHFCYPTVFNHPRHTTDLGPPDGRIQFEGRPTHTHTHSRLTELFLHNNNSQAAAEGCNLKWRHQNNGTRPFFVIFHGCFDEKYHKRKNSKSRLVMIFPVSRNIFEAGNYVHL